MSSEPLWLIEARKGLGECTVAGLSVNNPYIVGLYAVCNHPEIKQDEVAWCAAFTGAMLVRSGAQGTNSLLASSYADQAFGETLDEPRVGAIVVLDHHVGFVERIDPTHVWVLGGNQGKSEGKSAVTIAQYRRSSVLRYVWPVPLVTAATLTAQGSRATAKGRMDQAVGVGLKTAGVAALSQSGPAIPAPSVAASLPGADQGIALLEHAMRAAGALRDMITNAPTAALLLACGFYLVASGTLARIWRVQDANSGRSSATSAAAAPVLKEV